MRWVLGLSHGSPSQGRHERLARRARETCTFTDQTSVKRQWEKHSPHIHAAARPVAPHQIPSRCSTRGREILISNQRCETPRLKKRGEFSQVRRIILRDSEAYNNAADLMERRSLTFGRDLIKFAIKKLWDEQWLAYVSILKERSFFFRANYEHKETTRKKRQGETERVVLR